MGQKVNPLGLRLGIATSWSSNWYSDDKYAENLRQDISIREYIKKHLSDALVSKVEIEKTNNRLKVSIHTAKVGIVIGKRGEESDKLKKKLSKIAGQDVSLNIREVKKPESDSQLIAIYIARQLERRSAFRRVIKRALQNSTRSNISGCKIMVSGRLNGAEMARTEYVREGRIPLHTLKANIDYATFEAKTIYGIIGIKVWTYRKPRAAGYRDSGGGRESRRRNKGREGV